MTDAERRRAAHKFFWEMMGDQIVSFDVAERQIRKLAEALPPFTRLGEADNGE